MKILKICAAVIVALLLLVLLSWSQSVDREKVQSLFHQGNETYREKQFERAAELYQQIIQRGINNPLVFYNAGNAYYMSGERGKAVLMYERARRLAPRDPDIRQNLSQIQPAINRQAPFFLLLPITWFKNLFSLNEFLLIVEALYLLFAFCLIGYLLVESEKRFWFKGALKPLGILLIIIVLFTGVKIYEEQLLQRGIVIPDKTVVRSGPGEQFSEILVLPAGTRFRQLRASQEGWIRIRLPDGKSGYLHQEGYQLI